MARMRDVARMGEGMRAKIMARIARMMGENEGENGGEE